ncbi:hypothetical protein XENORESO_016817 [Xenotaenia resolanae]|uniref:Uncharacterized protein n=1 Tax=Xenotaenia resolanae TaxID=208358 RepID=A0ABV0WI64_9TELE
MMVSCSKASPLHDTSNSVFCRRNEVVFLECCIWSMPNISVSVPTKFNFRLIRSNQIIPEVLVFVYVLSDKIKPALCVFLKDQMFSPCTISMEAKRVQSSKLYKHADFHQQT